MNPMLRQALRKTSELRHQVEVLLLGDEGDMYEKELRKWVAKRPCWVGDQSVGKSKRAKKVACPTSILRPIQSGLIIPETDGTENLSDEAVFSGDVDPDLENWGCNVVSEARPETTTAVHELSANGTFQQIFSGQGVDLGQLCLTPHQIKKFVITHRQHLHPQGYSTFFLFKVEEDFFVAHVYWSGARRLKVDVDRLARDDVWDAAFRHRVVLPQTLKPSV